MAQVSTESEQAAAAPAVGANATPLGLFAFAITLFVLSLINAGLLKDAGFAIAIGATLFLGGLVMLLVGMWEFRGGNNFTATVFSSFAAFWLSFGFLLLPGSGILAELVKENALAPALGFYLLAWTIYVVLLTICVLRTNMALIGTFVFLLLTLVALTIGFLAGVPSLLIIGGYLGIITSIFAAYLGFAGILPYINPGIKLPVGPVS